MTRLLEFTLDLHVFGPDPHVKGERRVWVASEHCRHIIPMKVGGAEVVV